MKKIILKIRCPEEGCGAGYDLKVISPPEGEESGEFFSWCSLHHPEEGYGWEVPEPQLVDLTWSGKVEFLEKRLGRGYLNKDGKIEFPGSWSWVSGEHLMRISTFKELKELLKDFQSCPFPGPGKAK